MSHIDPQLIQQATAGATGQLGQIISLDDALNVLKTAKGIEQNKQALGLKERQLQLTARDAGFQFGPGGTIEEIPAPDLTQQLGMLGQIEPPTGGVVVPTVEIGPRGRTTVKATVEFPKALAEKPLGKEDLTTFGFTPEEADVLSNLPLDQQTGILKQRQGTITRGKQTEIANQFRQESLNLRTRAQRSLEEARKTDDITQLDRLIITIRDDLSGAESKTGVLTGFISALPVVGAQAQTDLTAISELREQLRRVEERRTRLAGGVPPPPPPEGGVTEPDEPTVEDLEKSLRDLQGQ